MKGGRRILLFLAGTGLLSTSGRAEEIAVAFRDVDRGRYELEGRFSVPVARSSAWEVLSDYDNIGAFVPSVKSSRVLKRWGNEAVIEQSMSGGVFIFSRRVSLKLAVRETPLERISFEEIAHVDFLFYAGEWRLEDSPEGTSVVYRLTAEPRFHVPGFLERGAFKRAVRDLLSDVRREIHRRSVKEGDS